MEYSGDESPRPSDIEFIDDSGVPADGVDPGDGDVYTDGEAGSSVKGVVDDVEYMDSDDDVVHNVSSDMDVSLPCLASIVCRLCSYHPYLSGAVH